MKKLIISSKQKRQLIKESRILTESISLIGKTLINVDIQPEYESAIHFLPQWVKFLNKTNASIIFLYNGGQMGMISESEYAHWLFQLGVKERVLNSSQFYDKGYAYFRYCIDSAINEDEIVSLIKFMIHKNINDSRDLDEEFWDDFVETYPYEDIRDLLEFSDDMINIPDLMDFLKYKNNIVLTGGGIYECLKEVEIALMALDKSYQILNEFTY
jgi:hypothetical protein